MRVTFDDRMVGVELEDLMLGDVVEVLANEGDIRIKGGFCLVCGRLAALSRTLYSLEDGQEITPEPTYRYRRLDAEMILRPREEGRHV